MKAEPIFKHGLPEYVENWFECTGYILKIAKNIAKNIDSDVIDVQVASWSAE